MSELKISDELMARYIDGLTTPEESTRVENALATDDALMEEFVLMAEAARLADAKPVMAPSMEKAVENVHAVVGTSQTGERKHVWLRVSAAVAAVAAVLVVVLLVVKPFQETSTLVSQNNTAISETADAVVPHVKNSPSTTKEQSQSENIIGNKTDENSAVVQDEIAEVQSNESSTNNTNEGEALMVQKQEKNYASAAETNHLSVEKPAKANFRILCKNLDKNFTFQWKASNVKTLSFTLKTKQGKTIAEQNDAQSDHFTITYRKIYPENQFLWCVSVIYNDGKREQRSGVLQIDYEVNSNR